MKIEVGKFYKTTTGLKVRIYATDGQGDYCIHGAVLLIGGGWDDSSWNWGGQSIYDSCENIISEWDENIWYKPVPLGPEHGMNYVTFEGPAPEPIFIQDDWAKWLEKARKAIEDSIIYGTGSYYIPSEVLYLPPASNFIADYTGMINANLENITAVNIMSCSCGGKINTHKPECPENQSEITQDLTPFYILDEMPQRYLGMSHKKCECGSESVGSQKHSQYCPKYEVE